MRRSIVSMRLVPACWLLASLACADATAATQTARNPGGCEAQRQQVRAQFGESFFQIQGGNNPLLYWVATAATMEDFWLAWSNYEDGRQSGRYTMQWLPTPEGMAWLNDREARRRTFAQGAMGMVVDLGQCWADITQAELQGRAPRPAAPVAAAVRPAIPAVPTPQGRSEQELSDPTVRPPAGTRGDWDPAAMKEGEEALEEVLNPSTANATRSPPASQRVIARDGQVATCVSIETISAGDSTLSGGGRVLVNNCSDTVEIGWCTLGGECERGLGNQWDVQPGRSWPVPAEKQVRWGACHGANTFHGDPGSQGSAFTCSAPLGAPPSSAVPTGAGRSNEN